LINFDEYVTWPSLCDDIKLKTNQNYVFGTSHPSHYALARDGKLPYSISEYEFNFMKNFIVDHNLTKGFELATGTCISTLAIGYGMSKTSGKLISIDSYEEEVSQNQPVHSTGKTYESPDYLMNIQLINAYNLQETVDVIKGWSPKDCEQLIDQNYKNNVDFVFFDCPKSKEDFIRDASLFVSRINKEKFAIFVHDTHCFMSEFNALGFEMFGVKPRQITEFPSHNKTVTQVFPLSVITNI
jgi:hypothetical protein